MKDGKTIFERLDDVARLTGVPQLREQFASPRRRPMRWSPLVMLVVATIAYGMMVASPKLQPVGMLLMGPCMGLSSVFGIIGPLRPWGKVELADERERLERSRAYLFAFTVAFVAGYLAFLGLGFALLVTAVARERLAGLIMYFAMYQFILITTLPTLYASWTTLPLPLDGDDDLAPTYPAIEMARLNE